MFKLLYSEGIEVVNSVKKKNCFFPGMIRKGACLKLNSYRIIDKKIMEREHYDNLLER
jgi:hypothetical protein